MLGKIDPALSSTVQPVTATLKTAKAGLSVYGAGLLSQPPITTSGGGSCNILGTPLTSVVAGAKLSGVATCDQTSLDPTQYPLNGKFKLSYVGGQTKNQSYVRVLGFDPSAPDVIDLTGVVTKGDGVGATISGSVFFDPVIKAGKGDPNGIPKNAYYFDVAQISSPCGSGGAPIANVYSGDGTSLLGSPAAGIAFNF